MAQSPTIEITIYINNREYALRVWPAVPRVGDEVMLRRMSDDQPRKVLDEHAIAIVETACWGTSERSRESP